MIETIYGAVLGVLAGLAVHRISLFQIRRRSQESKSVEAVENVVVIALCSVIGALLFGVIFKLYSDTLTRIEYMFYILVALNVSIIDIDIRKIPNDSLLVLLVVRTVTMIIRMATGRGTVRETLFPAILGLAIGFILYMLPSFMRVQISPGDVKYCAMIGYCLGIYGFLETSVVMAVSVLFYLAYLIVSKKGNAKTVTMMGPHLSLGVVVTLLLPYTEIMTLLFGE